MMGSVLAAALGVCLCGSAAQPEVRVFYLSYAQVESLPGVLEQMVARNADGIGPLQSHWVQLKGRLTVDRERNALKAEGSPEALAALEQVLKVIDVPRPQVTLRYRRVKVLDEADLLGRPAAPPMGLVSAGHEAAVNARVTPGDWEARVAELVAAGKALVLNEGSVSVIDSDWGTVWLGEPEVPEPEFCLQAQPTVMEDGAFWLSLAYGTWRRTGRRPVPSGTAEGRDGPGEVCVNCGPGVGSAVLVPKFILTTRVEAGQSVLVGGVAWSSEEAGNLAAPADEWVVVSPSLEGVLK